MIDDDDDQEEQLKQSVEELNSEDEGMHISYRVAKNEKDATYLLYTEKFDGLIVDLKLNEGDEVGGGELSGNILLNNILEKELIPVIVRTGTPASFSNKFEDHSNIIKVYAKDDKDFYDHIKELVEWHNSSFFKIFGAQGEMRELINQLFWKIIPECFSSWDHKLALNMPDKDKAIIRYISSWLMNKYNYYEDQYTVQDPVEMYMFPNSIDQICTGDIFQKQNEYFVVLTPACDLANQKTENILLSKIISHKDIKLFNDHLEELIRLDKVTAERKWDKKVEVLSKWFRNGELARYHFLPKVSFFPGGFIDFQQISSVSYDAQNKRISELSFTKLGVLTDSFVKEIISRFGAYYQRQGQPEFNRDRVLEYLVKPD